jgi:hypothetical protein
VLTPLGGEPTFIAVDATNIYWVDARGARCRRCPRAGGPTTTLATYPPRSIAASENPTQLAVDVANVYWVEPGDAAAGCGNGSIMKVSLDGGVPTTVASGQGYPQGLALGVTDLCWANYAASTIVTLTSSQ